MNTKTFRIKFILLVIQADEEVKTRVKLGLAVKPHTQFIMIGTPVVGFVVTHKHTWKTTED
jgi:hypothetical protein